MIIHLHPFRTLLIAVCMGAVAGFFAVQIWQLHLLLIVPLMLGGGVFLAILVAITSLRQMDRALRVFFE